MTFPFADTLARISSRRCCALLCWYTLWLCEPFDYPIRQICNRRIGVSEAIPFPAGMNRRWTHYKAASAPRVDMRAYLAALIVANLSPGRLAIVAMLTPIRAPRV